MQAVSILRNDFRKNPKNSTVYTPPAVSNFLYDILSPVIKPKVILDPAIGKGSLTNPWRQRGIKILGVDIDKIGRRYCDGFLHSRFEDVLSWESDTPNLILLNPPFNGAGGNMMYPEVFLRKIVELFASEIPVVLFTAMGFRLNQRTISSRWQWLVEKELEIKSIITVFLDSYGTVKTHSEILIFNIDGLKPHYWCGVAQRNN